MVEERIESVEKILESTGYESLPQQIVFNKSDKTTKHVSARLGRIYDAPVISAQDKTNLPEVLNLLDRIVDKLLEPSPRESKVELQLNTA
jgi:50S ribosomal subunit-associated GTPase HflX